MSCAATSSFLSGGYFGPRSTALELAAIFGPQMGIMPFHRQVFSATLSSQQSENACFSPSSTFLSAKNGTDSFTSESFDVSTFYWCSALNDKSVVKYCEPATACGSSTSSEYGVHHTCTEDSGSLQSIRRFMAYNHRISGSAARYAATVGVSDTQPITNFNAGKFLKKIYSIIYSFYL